MESLLRVIDHESSRLAPTRFNRYIQNRRHLPLKRTIYSQFVGVTFHGLGTRLMAQRGRRLFGGDIERFFRAIAAGAVRALLLASTAHPIEAS
jgi:hypothetical protein